MANLETIAKWIFIGGVLLAAAGVVLWLLSRIPGIDKIPGSITLEGKNFTIIIPLLASVVISIILTVGLNLLLRIFRK
jgi:hypothetical protein